MNKCKWLIQFQWKTSLLYHKKFTLRLLQWLLQLTLTMKLFWALNVTYLNWQSVYYISLWQKMLRFWSTYITYCISGDELTISTSFKNGDVLFSWDNLQKTYYDVSINNAAWNRVNQPKYTVKDALMHSQHIRINVRVPGSSEDNILTYNGELCMMLALYFT